MPTIINFPVELLAYILELAQDPLTHANVCWVFNQIATPILYRRVHIYRRYEGLRTHNIHLFLQTIISRPVLRRSVRRLFAEPFDPAGEPDYTSPPPDIFPGFVAEAVSHGLSREIQEAIATGSIPAMLFLLLCYLPVLRELEIRLSLFGRDGGILHQQMLATSALPSGLQSVRWVKLSPWDCSICPEITWEMITAFFHLPALRWFICEEGLVKCGDLNVISCLLPGSSRIEHMEFTYSAIHNTALGALARSSRSLRTFVYKFDATTVVTFHPPSLGDVLRQCALNTLEHLEVNAKYSVGSLGPLSEFAKLTYIRSSLSLLLGTRDGFSTNSIARRLGAVLPVSLISLHLWIDPSWQGMSIVSVIEQFVKGRHDRLKQLKRLGVYGFVRHSDTQIIESMCKVEGLSIILPSFVDWA